MRRSDLTARMSAMEELTRTLVKVIEGHVANGVKLGYGKVGVRLNYAGVYEQDSTDTPVCLIGLGVLGRKTLISDPLRSDWQNPEHRDFLRMYLTDFGWHLGDVTMMSYGWDTRFLGGRLEPVELRKIAYKFGYDIAEIFATSLVWPPPIPSR